MLAANTKFNLRISATTAIATKLDEFSNTVIEGLKWVTRKNLTLKIFWQEL